MRWYLFATVSPSSMFLSAVVLFAQFSVAQASFFGVETSGIVGRSPSVDGSTSVNNVNYGPDGGNGVFSSTTVDNSNRGDFVAHADFSRVSAGVPVPVLNVDATGGYDGFFFGVAQAFSGAVSSYQYEGPSGNVTFNWNFKGELHEPDVSSTYVGITNSAFFNVRGGLMTDLLQFQTDVQLVNALNVGDSFIEAYNTNQESESFDESGSMSIFLNSGDIVSLTLRLSAWAGNPDAHGDAQLPVPTDAGLTGDFVLPSGGSLTAVPEPSSAALVVVAGIALISWRSTTQRWKFDCLTD